jgi:hypothetical protein
MKKESILPYIIIQQPIGKRKKQGFLFDYDAIIFQLEKNRVQNNDDFLSSKCSSTEELEMKEYQKVMQLEECKSDISPFDTKIEKINHVLANERLSKAKTKKSSKKLTKKSLNKISPTSAMASAKSDTLLKDSKKSKKAMYFLKKKEEMGLI